jgi:hypothetical protein
MPSDLAAFFEEAHFSPDAEPEETPYFGQHLENREPGSRISR